MGMPDVRNGPAITVELHVFTNCIPSAPSTALVERLYASFSKTFLPLPVCCWCDRHPNEERFSEYFGRVRGLFPRAHATESLSDGYVKAIQQSQADYLVMLEHDWVFRDTVRHSLNTILQAMRKHQICHLRFNQRTNIVAGEDRWLREVEDEDWKHCETEHLSNNPHIIDRRQYVERLLSQIAVRPGARGIEERLSHRGNIGAIYGGLGHRQTIFHLDGKTYRESAA